MSTAKEIYKKVNPDIPLIPEPFETLIEDVMLDRALDVFIDFTASKYDGKGMFKPNSCPEDAVREFLNKW